MLVASLRKIIKEHIVTEKTQRIENGYCFKVDQGATKQLIKKAIEHFFQVKVIQVRTCIVKQVVKQPGRQQQTIKTYKKAYVKIAPGQEIRLEQVVNE